MAQTDRKRPWLAAALSLASPGLGHLYLREWVRAALWFALVVSTTHVLGGTGVAPESNSLDAIFAAAMESVQTMPLETYLALSAITMLSMADAYWLAAADNHRRAAEEGVRCPNCGRELDQDLSFCHWCTVDLTDVADEQPVDV